jgi:hypothetical protein
MPTHCFNILHIKAEKYEQTHSLHTHSQPSLFPAGWFRRRSSCWKFIQNNTPPRHYMPTRIIPLRLSVWIIKYYAWDTERIFDVAPLALTVSCLVLKMLTHKSPPLDVKLQNRSRHARPKSNDSYSVCTVRPLCFLFLYIIDVQNLVFFAYLPKFTLK